MAVTKRLRYEILRRDNHACRYCGIAAPEVVLTVDHVLPTALGGDDSPTNLVAACRDCNAGKSASSPDATLLADVDADAIRWARARELAAERVRQDIINRNQAVTKVFCYWIDAFDGPHGDFPEWPDDADQSITYWLDHGLQLGDMYYLIDSAVVPRVGRVNWNKLYAYFAGCCWTRLRQIDSGARALIDQGEV